MVLVPSGSLCLGGLCAGAGARGASGGVLGTAAAQWMALNLWDGGREGKTPLASPDLGAHLAFPLLQAPPGLRSPVMEKGASESVRGTREKGWHRAADLR